MGWRLKNSAVLPGALFLLAAGVAALAVQSCLKEEKRNITDLIPHLDATIINYQSEALFVPGSVPLDEDLAPGQAGAITTRIAPVIVGISLGGYELVELKDAKVRFKMELSGIDFEGAVRIKLFIGNGVDIYNDPAAVRADKKQILPSVYEITAAEEKLKHIFAQREVVFGLEFTVEPSRIARHEIFLQGHVEQFEAEITGVTIIF